MQYLPQRTTVSVLLRLSAGDSALKQLLLAIYQPVVSSLTYSGHGRGRQVTSSRKKTRNPPHHRMKSFIFKGFPKVACCDL